MTARWTLAGLAAFVALTSCGKGGDGIADVLLVATVEVSPASGTLVLGGTTQLTATPKTASGLVVPGRAVAWSSSNAGSVSVSPSGVITANALGGPVQITATVDGVSGQAQFTVQPFPIARIEIAPQTTGVMVGSSTELVATAYDAQNNPLPGRVIFWQSSTPALAAVTSTGIVLGIAEGGPVTITATAEGKAGTATVTVAPRPPTQLGFLQQPSASTAGKPLSPAVRVAVRNDQGGTVTSANTQVTLALGANTGGATLGGTTTVAAVNGIATFDDLSLDKAGAGYTLVATAASLTSATSTPFSNGAGPASQVVLTTPPPASATSGQPLSPQPVLQLRDAFGNAVGQADVSITVSVASGSATLSGSTTASTNSAGVANFATLTLSGSGSSTLAFSAPGLTPAASGPISLAPPAPASLAMVTQPSATAQNGVVFAVQPAVRLRDGSGADLNTAGVAIAASLASGPAGGTLTGGTVVQTSGSGIAAFSDLAIVGPPGSYTIGFTSSGLNPATSSPIVVTVGPPSQLAIITQPPASSPNGATLASQPVVQLRDASGSPVAKSGVIVTATIASGGGSLGGTTSVATDAAGVASFTDLSITGLVGSKTLGFSSPTLSGATSTAITLTAGPAVQIAIVVQPSGFDFSGVPLSRQPVIQIQDASGNPVPMAGVLITASLNSGPGTLGGNVAINTNSAGTAVYSSLVITGLGAYTLRFSGASFADVISSLILVF